MVKGIEFKRGRYSDVHLKTGGFILPIRIGLEDGEDFGLLIGMVPGRKEEVYLNHWVVNSLFQGKRRFMGEEVLGIGGFSKKG